MTQRVEQKAYPAGDDHHRAKVTEAQIERMRKMRAQGWTGSEIAREFGIVKDTVYRLTNGKGRVPR